MDLVIRNARVVDGTGAPWFRSDVAIDGGRIAALEPELSGRRIVDADDRVLAPGFIDMHSHGDVRLLNEPDAMMCVAQGVTTELVGQDGISCAPALAGLEQYVARAVRPLDGEPKEGWNWTSVGEYLDRLDHAVPVNVAYLVPHGTVRAQVLRGEDRPASTGEARQICDLIRSGLSDGAFGVSTGLEYAPSRQTTFAELQVVLDTLAQVGGIHATHIRNYDTEFDDAIEEMLHLGALTGARTHFSHFITWGYRNHGRMPELLEVLEAARSAGIDTSIDLYPYESGSTVATFFLPDEMRELETEQLLTALQDANTRKRFSRMIEAGPCGVDITWAEIEVASGAEALGLQGGRIPEISSSLNRTVGDTVCELLAATRGEAVLIAHACRPDDVESAISHRLSVLGSDGIPLGERPHPRGWGAFSRVLETYVRERRVLSLEDAIAMMSGRAAARLGIPDRGVIRPGAAADLVLFDPTAVSENATFASPMRLATGVTLVLVNGTPVWREGASTGELPGVGLRRQSRQHAVPRRTIAPSA